MSKERHPLVRLFRRVRFRSASSVKVKYKTKVADIDLDSADEQTAGVGSSSQVRLHSPLKTDKQTTQLFSEQTIQFSSEQPIHFCDEQTIQLVPDQAIRFCLEQTTQLCSEQIIPFYPELATLLRLEQKIQACPEQKTQPYPEQKMQACPEQKTQPCPEQKMQACPEQKIQTCPEQKTQPCPEQKMQACPEQKVQACPEQKLQVCFEQKIQPCPEQIVQICHDGMTYDWSHQAVQLCSEQRVQFYSEPMIPSTSKNTTKSRPGQTTELCVAQSTVLCPKQTSELCAAESTVLCPKQMQLIFEQTTELCVAHATVLCPKQTQLISEQTTELCVAQATVLCPKQTQLISERTSSVCPVCLAEKRFDEFPRLQSCEHRTCRDCLTVYLKIEISQSRVSITCPQCDKLIHPNDLELVLQDIHTMMRYERFMLRRVIVTEPDARWCPAPDCGYAVIASGCASCPKLKCERPGCGTFFCYHCRQTWHPDRACVVQAEDMCSLPSIQSAFRNKNDSIEIHSQTGDVKACPRCNSLFLKLDNDGTCNEMVCSCCGAHFCWQCLREITDYHFFGHSGCTYYGRRRWSKRKRILVQLGMLIGAPVAIVVAITISVPAMMVSIPTWVGLKIFDRYEGKRSRHKRNLVIVGGVTASIVAAPVITGICVAIAMPGIVGYVYGVVPLSLVYTCMTPASTTP